MKTVQIGDCFEIYSGTEQWKSRKFECMRDFLLLGTSSRKGNSLDQVLPKGLKLCNAAPLVKVFEGFTLFLDDKFDELTSEYTTVRG